MKVALVTYSLNVGGVESLIFNLASLFYKSGHEVEIIETFKKGKGGEVFNNFIKVKSFETSLFTIPIIHSKRIIKYLNSFDAIFINDSPYAQAGCGLLKKGIKVFPVLHMDVPTMVKNALSNLECINKIICVSPQGYNIIQQLVGTSKSTFIPNGVPVTASKGKRRNYNEKLEFLYVGRLENKQKGVLLIPYIANILKINGLDFVIEIIGEGPSMQELNDLIKHLQLQDRLFVRGTMNNSQVNALMTEKHFLLMPSFYEGLPLVLLEGMNAGMIPIVSLLPGNTDICVEEGISGFFGIPGDVESFANAVQRAANSRAKLSEISNNAIRKVQMEFNSTKMFSKYEKLITENKRSTRNGKIDCSILPEYPYAPRIIGKALNRFHKLIKQIL